MKKLMFLFLVVLSVNSIYGQSINVKDHIDLVGSTYANQTEAIQGAVNAASRKKLFFPKGTYIVNKTIKLPENIIFEGESSFGVGEYPNHSSQIFKERDNFNGEYLFEVIKDTAWPNITIENMLFNGNRLLDLRVNDTATRARCLINNSNFINSADNINNDEIAINLQNNDFSIIKNCNFMGFKGNCAIKISGSDDSENSTQLKIRDCIFSVNSKIGISINRVNSVVISGCDFGSTNYPIDIGSRIYSLITPGAEPQTGIFSDINIRDNHIESPIIGVYADGHRTLNHGIRVESNNFMREKAKGFDIIMMYFIGINGLSTRNNEIMFAKGPIDSVNSNKIVGIKYKNCRYPKFMMDNFYCDIANEATGIFSSWATDYVDEGGNLNPLIQKGHFGGEMYFPNEGNLVSDSTLNEGLTYERNNSVIKIPEVKGNWTALPDNYFYPNRIIRVSKQISQSDTIILLPQFPVTSAGLIYLNVSIDGENNFQSTWSIGQNSITKISGDDILNSYDLILDGNNVVLKSNFVNTEYFYIQGIFQGVSFKFN